MINYFFSYTGRKEYVDVVKCLDKDFVAKPSLLFGDGRLDDQFNLYYPGKVIKEKNIYASYIYLIFDLFLLLQENYFFIY
jgi:hypothetical protein